MISHEHHDHNHQDVELITFVDDQGNEELFEVLMEIDGTEEEEVETYVYTYTEDENGEKVDFQEIPEDADAEWEMIDEVVATLFDEE